MSGKGGEPMTAPPDLSALVAAVERAATTAETLSRDFAVQFPGVSAESKRDAALLSRLAVALKGAERGWQGEQTPDVIHLNADHKKLWSGISWRRVLVLTWEER